MVVTFSIGFLFYNSIRGDENIIACHIMLSECKSLALIVRFTFNTCFIKILKTLIGKTSVNKFMWHEQYGSCFPSNKEFEESVFFVVYLI